MESLPENGVFVGMCSVRVSADFAEGELAAGLRLVGRAVRVAGGERSAGFLGGYLKRLEVVLK